MAFVELERGSPASYAFVRDMRRKIWNEEREREFLRLASGKTCFILDESLSLTERLAELPKPCGLLAATDAVARKAIDAAHLAGIEMPDELRIVGINNDTFICEFSNPTITSVHPDFEECGYIAMEALHKIVENPDAEPKVLFGMFAQSCGFALQAGDRAHHKGGNPEPAHRARQAAAHESAADNLRRPGALRISFPDHGHAVFQDEDGNDHVRIPPGTLRRLAPAIGA